MTFQSPLVLWGLLLIPLVLGVYLWILRRRRRFAVRYADLSLVRAALPKRSRLRQHLPFGLFLLGLAALLTAAARPGAEVLVPLSRTTIILALDSSRSMCATDVDPNRLSIAQEAALEFIDAHAETNRIGLVAFAGFAELLVPPTNDKELLLSAVRNLTTSIGTAIGSATLESIDAIASINEAVARSGVDLGAEGGGPAFEEGFFLPDIIVLLTDGANSRGPDPIFAALQAADRGLRVYTIGFGTTEPTEMVCTASQLGGDLFDDDFGFGGFGGGSFGGFGGGFRRFLLLDEPTLMTIADVTGGEYYRAESAGQLFDVFEDLPAEVVLQRERMEISVYFAAAGAAFAALAFLLSIQWFRIP